MRDRAPRDRDAQLGDSREGCAGVGIVERIQGVNADAVQLGGNGAATR